MTRGVTGTSAGGTLLDLATPPAMTAPSFRLPVGPAHLPPRSPAVGPGYPLDRARRAFVTVPPPNDAVRRSVSPAQQGAGVRLCTLGAALVQVGAAQITPASGILFSLLVRLAHAPGLGVSRERLVAELWPGHDPFRQRANLRQALYKLRAMGVRVGVGGEVVSLDAHQLLPSFALTRTAELFEAQVLSGAEPFGPFLPGVAGEGEFAEWLELQRGLVHAEARRVLVDALRQRRERGDWGGTEAVARALLQLDPLNEEATLQLAECTLLAGARPEALRLLDRYVDEVGELPEEMRRRVAALRRRMQEPAGRPARVREAPPDDRLFLGRDAELATLTLALRRARWQDGSAALVHGAPGIGKTRLVQELGRVATIEGFRELRLACREGDETSGYQLLSTLVQQLLALPGALGCSPEGLRRLRQQWPERGSAEGRGERGPIDAVEQAATREALVDLVTAIAEERPLLVVVEDVHWADAGSWQVLQLFAGAAATSRLLLLFTSRERSPAQLRAVALAPRLAVLGVEPLAGEPLAALSGALVGLTGRGGDGEVGSGGGVPAQLAAVSQGNPLFLRALVQHWADTGEVEGIPRTLTGLLETRMNRLRAPSLMVLQAIGLLGALATTERLVSVLGVPTSALLTSLEELSQADCIRSALPNHVTSHDLVARAALDRLSAAGAAVLRGAIADALLAELRRTRRGADGVASGASGLLLAVLEQLALSGRWPAWGAVLEEEQAGVLALGNPAPVLSQAAVAAEQAPAVVAWSGVRSVLAQLQGQAGNYEESLRLAGDVASLAGMVSGLSEREATALLGYLWSVYYANTLGLGRYAGQAIANIAELATLSPHTRMTAARRGMVVARNTGDPETAARCFRAATAAPLLPDSDVDMLELRMIYQCDSGSLDEAEHLAFQLLGAIDRNTPSTKTANLLFCAGLALRKCNQIEAAYESLEASFAMCFNLGLPSLAIDSALQRSSIARGLGDVVSCREWEAITAQLYAQLSNKFEAVHVAAYLCRAAIESQDISLARDRRAQYLASFPRRPTPTELFHRFGVELGYSMLQPQASVNPELLEAALVSYANTILVGFNDFPVSMIAQALTIEGRQQEARHLVTGYVRERRGSREPLAHCLRQVIETLRLAGPL